jgi:Ca2+-binding EF-hand superfamily protein
VVLLAGAAMAQAPKPTTRPGPKTTATIDYVSDLIDMYFQGAERDRFFTAAGVDGQLTQEEFVAAGGKAKSFVRPYDRWQAAAVFDGDHSGRLNWVEAEQYRLAVRARVMLLFDKDKDGRLRGPEREAANLYLATGMGRARLAQAGPQRLLAPPKPPGARPDAAVWAGPEADPAASAPPWWRDRWRKVVARFDRDRDGKLAGEERLRMQRSLRWHQRRRLMMRFDKDNNGRLDADESAAVELAESKEAQALRQQWELAEWDSDGSGKLEPPEQAAMEANLADRRRIARQRHELWVKRWDRNGDARVSAAERAAAIEGMRRRVARQRREMDTNGDGKITADEIRAYRKKLFNRPREATAAPGSKD